MKAKVLSILIAAACFGPGAGMARAADVPFHGLNEEQYTSSLFGQMVQGLLVSKDASELTAKADKMAAESPWQALTLYLSATREDKKQIWAPYQAAAMLARLEHEELAEDYLKIADERGMWFAPVLAEDDDFSAMRNNETFKTVLAHAKERYKVKAEGKVGAMSVINPPADKAVPAGGWPVVVWLHGYGVNGQLSSRDDGYKLFADDGAVVIGINGTEMLSGEGSFRWAGPGYEGTQKAVRQALAKLAGQQKINLQRVYLMGFSQGSQHAGALLAQHPKDYAGALLISPGGNQNSPTASLAKGKRVFVVNGKTEHKSNQAMTQDFRQLLGKGNTLKFIQHEGGHSFPDDWRTSLPKAMRWLMSNES